MIEYPDGRIRQGAEGRRISGELFPSLKVELSREEAALEPLWWPGLEDGHRMIEAGHRNVVAGWAVAWLSDTAIAAVVAPRQTVSLTASSAVVGPAAGSGSVSITADQSWTAASSEPWVTVTPPSGTGSATLNYSYTANAGTTGRTATITVFGQAFTVMQAAGATVALSAGSATVVPSASAGSFNITVTPAALSWTAASSDSWLTVSPASGTGSATLNYSYSANPFNSGRMAAITVLGQAYTVTQAAANANFTPWGVWGFGLIRTMFEHVLNRTPLEIWGDGEIVRDFIYIDDIADACIALLDKEHNSGSYNIGFGEGYSINSVLRQLEAVCKTTVSKKFLPARQIDVQSIVLNTQSLRQLLEWKPKIELEQGLTLTWKWLNHRTKKK